MELKILCPQWGLEELDLEDFILKIKEAGYDGIDTWIPEDKNERSRLISLLNRYDLKMVSHQHQATGSDIKTFCKSFENYLNLAAETDPLLINSHSGKDYFSIDDQCRVIDVAEKFSSRYNIPIAHETHRGRMLYCPQHARQLFQLRPSINITADFSHWVCVTESYLENFESIVNDAINKTIHVHARVGFPEGPQIPDPRSPYWQESLNIFLEWWQRIMISSKNRGAEILTITCEFGPAPYLWTNPSNNKPVVSQWEINLFMQQLLRKNFQHLT